MEHYGFHDAFLQDLSPFKDSNKNMFLRYYVIVTVNNKILVKRIQVRVNNILSDFLKDVFNGTNTVLAQRQLKSILRFLTNDGEN